MPEEKSDRRVQRTRKQLQHALMVLVQEKDYDAITIQDITERANVGRSTFYLHYENKDQLLLDHYAHLLEHLNLERWSGDELLCKTEAKGLIQFLEMVANARGFYLAILNARDAEQILRGMQARLVANLQDSLTVAFPEQESRLPLVVLCNYVAGAQLALIKWWVTSRNDYDTRQIGHMIQRLQYVAIRDAYQLD